MSYPNLPENRLIVNGVDLTERYNLVLVDGYTLEPPEPKTYTVDIPGGNGVIDLTDALSGDTVYNNRSQEFELYAIGVDNFEKLKTDVSNLLHGKSFNYKITMDPDYTYHGRFTVSSYEHSMYGVGKVGVIKIKIDADPYKYKKQQVFQVDAVGGKIVYCPSGRLRVRPTIETKGFLRVIFDNKKYELPQGTWSINDLLFTYGNNEIYFCSYDIRNYLWKNFKTNSVTWGNFKQKRLFEWYKSNGDGTYVVRTWDEVSDLTWSAFSEYAWSDMQHIQELISNLTWSDLKSNSISWREFKTKSLLEWYKFNGGEACVVQMWKEVADHTWADLSDKSWLDLRYFSDKIAGVEDVYIAYEWGDL